MPNRMYPESILKISIGMLITFSAGLVAIAIAYAKLDTSIQDTQSEVVDLKHQISKINDIQTDVAVIKFQIIEINKKLGQ